MKPVKAITPNPVHAHPPPPAQNNGLDLAQAKKARKAFNVGALQTDLPRADITGHQKALAGAEAFLQAGIVTPIGKTGPVHPKIEEAVIGRPNETMYQPLWYRPSML